MDAYGRHNSNTSRLKQLLREAFNEVREALSKRSVGHSSYSSLRCIVAGRLSGQSIERIIRLYSLVIFNDSLSSFKTGESTCASF